MFRSKLLHTKIPALKDIRKAAKQSTQTLRNPRIKIVWATFICILCASALQ